MLKVNMTCKYRDNIIINACLHKNRYVDRTQGIEERSTNKKSCKGDDGVTVTLEWTQANPLYTYHINSVQCLVDPEMQDLVLH